MGWKEGSHVHNQHQGRKVGQLPDKCRLWHKEKTLFPLVSCLPFLQELFVCKELLIFLVTPLLLLWRAPMLTLPEVLIRPMLT